MIEQLDCVAPTEDIAEYDLKADDVSAVVMVHNEGAGFEVEFMVLNGETLAIVTLLATQVRPARSVAKSPMLGKWRWLDRCPCGDLADGQRIGHLMVRCTDNKQAGAIACDSAA